MALIEELKRRNVFRVGGAYLVIGWLIAQATQLALDSFEAPAWVMKTILLLLVVGLPLALFFAWAFEVTPEGLKKEKDVDRSRSITAQTGRKLDVIIIGVMGVALAYFVADKFWLDTGSTTPAEQLAAVDQTTAKTIAVLPFVNMSDDKQNEYFSDGLTEELLNSLARINELKVTGRTSSFAFKGKNVDLREIGAALNVAHILEGSVRKAQDRVRITAQLVKVDDGYHLWSDTFDRKLDDIFAIQEEIATEVAQALHATLLGDGESIVRPGTNSTQAYEAYLRGRYVFDRGRDDQGARSDADEFYLKALELDPDFTLAWYGRFMVSWYNRRTGTRDYTQGLAEMREISDRMVEMDPQLAESWVATGRTAISGMDWNRAAQAYKRAMELNPRNIDVLSGKVALAAVQGRKAEALELALTAEQLDPLSLDALRAAAANYSRAGACDEVRGYLEKIIGLESRFSRIHAILGNCLLLEQNNATEAIAYLRKEPVGYLRMTGLAIAHWRLGEADKAQIYFDELVAANGDAASYQYAQIYASWGETEKALEALEKAYEIGDSGFVIIKMDRYMDPLRNEPRFQALMEKWADPAKR